MSEAIIEVQRRDGTGKGVARRLRKQNLVPAVLYGADREPIAIQVPRAILLKLFKDGGHENRIFLLRLAGTEQTRHAMVRDMQLDAGTDQITHLDFQRIAMDKTIRVSVHVEVEGIAYGVKTEGGVLDFVTRELEIETLPANIPQRIMVDVTNLQIGQHLEARELQLPEGVTFVGSPDAVVVSVKHARAEEAAEETKPEALTEAAAEPEVIQRGKKEEAEES
jgi:large subunit ribosomal protein L25